MCQLFGGIPFELNDMGAYGNLSRMYVIQMLYLYLFSNGFKNCCIETFSSKSTS